jgi:hypothetical protein
MGDNVLGASQRGSHWETRIMNDEFMAYGQVVLTPLIHHTAGHI